jgi:peptidoglycan hydrolase-like protein with peptidoglycan-binding domain
MSGYNISLRIRLLLSIFVAGGMMISSADAKSQTAPKQGKATAKPAAGSKVTGKSRKSSPRKRVASRRSAPRQSAPTPERYREIQQALTDKGYGAGPVDGNWGAEWVNALKKFQTNQNLSSDGKLGSLSLIALGLGPKRDPITEFAGKPGSIE